MRLFLQTPVPMATQGAGGAHSVQIVYDFYREAVSAPPTTECLSMTLIYRIRIPNARMIEYDGKLFVYPY
jgi:hypothetical protein